MKAKIAFWYKHGIWAEKMVWDAVSKNVLTKEEAAEILEHAQSSVPKY